SNTAIVIIIHFHDQRHHQHNTALSIKYIHFHLISLSINWRESAIPRPLSQTSRSTRLCPHRQTSLHLLGHPPHQHDRRRRRRSRKETHTQESNQMPALGSRLISCQMGRRWELVAIVPSDVELE